MAIHTEGIGCIVSSGVSTAKLRRAAHAGSNEYLRFNLKFFAVDTDGTAIHMSSGSGTPVILQVSSLHETGSGCHVSGTIVKFRPNGFDHYGGVLSRYVDQLQQLVAWFQPGHEIRLIHRGAATEGIVISLLNPITQEKLAFATKRPPNKQPRHSYS